MAEPTNTGAGGPPSSGGGNPIDPGTANVLERMATALDLANQKAASSEQILQKMAEHAGAVADEAGRASGKLKDMFKLSDDIEENYKRIVEYGKKRSQQSLKEFRDAGKARKELEEMVKLYQAGLKGAKETSKEYKAMTRNLGEIEKTLKALPRDGQLLDNEIQKVADAFERASHNAKDLVKGMSNLGRHAAALKGMTGILGALGADRGVNAKHNRRIEQIEEVRSKIKEAKELRKTATKKHMTDKRDRAVAEADAEGRDLKSPEGLSWLSKKMGFKPGTAKYSKFLKGEIAGGPTAAGEAGAGWSGAMAEGAGPIEGVMSGLEAGLEGLMVGLEAVALPLTILIEAIDGLIFVFDTFAKQNLEMSKSLGKAGLFTQPGIGVGDAFAKARTALMPPVGDAALHGFTFEKNVELAGAFANAGYAPHPWEGGNQANEAPGGATLGSPYMQGSMGEAQRVVMAGQAGGLTDAEGTENLIKLLDRYHETMASSEMFMARINKDTQAAGISTTKYLKIIDEVNGAFDKMGKSLEQVTGIMRELTRYGGISAETLKDMMEGLLNAGPKATMGDAALSGFANNLLQNTPLLANMQAATKNALAAKIDNINVEAGRNHMEGLDKAGVNDLIDKGDYKGAVAKANEMKDRINQMSDDNPDKQTMLDATNEVMKAIPQVATVMAKTAMGRTFGEINTGGTPILALGKNIALLREAARQAHTDMATMFATGGVDAESKGIIAGLNDAFKQAGGTKPFQLAAEDEAENRIENVRQKPKAEQAEAAKVLVNELFHASKTNKPIGTWVKDNLGLGKVMKDNGVDSLDALLQTKDGVEDTLTALAANSDTLGTTDESVANLVLSAGDSNKMDNDALKQNQKTAADVASRSQTVEGILKHSITPILGGMLSGIESIVGMIKKLPWFMQSGVMPQRVKADFGKEGNLTKAEGMLAQNNKNLFAQRKPLDDLVKKGIKLTPEQQKTYDGLTDAINDNIGNIDKLAEVLAQTTYTSKEQMDIYEKGIDRIAHGQKPDFRDTPEEAPSHTMRNATLVSLSGLGGMGVVGAELLALAAASAGRAVHNVFYSSDSTMNVAQQGSAATSPTEQANAQKLPSAKKGP